MISSPRGIKFLSLCISLLLLCICCQRQSGDGSEKTGQSTFKPKGVLSDLVYNAVRSDGTIDSSFLPILTLDVKEFDFGTLYEGDIVKKEFTFTNTGTAPLLIINATSTCGCTVPEWPKEVILPGKTGAVVVKFDSANKQGAQNKQVTIFANTFPNRSLITIKGTVVKTK